MSFKDEMLQTLASGPATRTELLSQVKGLTNRSIGQLAKHLVKAGQAAWKWRDGEEVLTLTGASGPAAAADEPEPKTDFALWTDGSVFIRRGDESFGLSPDDVSLLFNFLRRTHAVPMLQTMTPAAITHRVVNSGDVHVD